MKLPLLAGADLDAPLALRGGRATTRRQYLADVHALAEALPPAGPMLNTTADRYRFAVGLGAAMLRGHANLMPSNHTPDTVARLAGLYPGVYALTEAGAPTPGLPAIAFPPGPAAALPAAEVPQLDAALQAAIVLTSGSTGSPLPHPKHWGLLTLTMQSGARRLARLMGRADLAGVALVATVPPQHMYGFESSVLLALLAGAMLVAERPFYPADVAAALARAPRPRLLVTTPYHLKTLLDAGLALPPLDLVLCATAPLSPQLAARAEAAFAAPLAEIYGCTEAGQVATRRTTAGAEWTVYDGLVLAGDSDETVVHGGHVPEPTRLADVLEVVDAQRFRWLGRSNDLVNVAGKRSSLGHLNYHLNSVPGVVDGAFLPPPDDPAGGMTRLAAFVVAPGVPAERILLALRQRIDAAFLPRPIVPVPALPREPTGKLPMQAFAAWAAPHLAAAARPASPPVARSVPGDPTSPAIEPAAAARASMATAIASAPAASAATYEVEWLVPADHPAFAGHFPGEPLLPGAALLAEVLEAALAEPALAALLGPAPTLAAAKFLAPVRPGARLHLRLRPGAAHLDFELRCGDTLAASGRYDGSPGA